MRRRADRIAQIVQRIKDRYQIVAAGVILRGCDLKAHTIGHTRV